MEIEKKFKIKKLPDNLEQYEQKHIEQGYLCTNPVVRIRKSNDRYILTYKSLVSGSEDKNTDVRINNEVEVFLTKEGYEHLREKVDDNLIKKTRYIIPWKMDIWENLIFLAECLMDFILLRSSLRARKMPKTLCHRYGLAKM